MDSGNGRYLSLEFTDQDGAIAATVPTEPTRAVYGWYLLFALVDDVPYEARLVGITE